MCTTSFFLRTLSMFALAILSVSVSTGDDQAQAELDNRIKKHRKTISFTSRLDQSQQKAFLIHPEAITKTPVPIVVSLHTWSGDMSQRNHELERLVHARGWYYLFPNFRGRNDSPPACGSELAQQDILDAIDAAIERYPIDQSKVLLTGVSGGGHMTMLMAARYPERWKAASAWVGISDLSKWYAKHKGGKYGQMMERVCGGPTGQSKEIDEEYRQRSPITHMAGAANVAIDLAAGIHDGHTGSVPISQSIEAFNAIATANGDRPVSLSHRQQLSTPKGRLTDPLAGDVGFDKSFGRDFYLRRKSGNARLTIFEGGHEGIATAAMHWLETHCESE